jgi:hypothetical protein
MPEDIWESGCINSFDLDLTLVGCVRFMPTKAEHKIYIYIGYSCYLATGL